MVVIRSGSQASRHADDRLRARLQTTLAMDRPSRQIGKPLPKLCFASFVALDMLALDLQGCIAAASAIGHAVTGGSSSHTQQD
jgi:hypothetical protein